MKSVKKSIFCLYMQIDMNNQVRHDVQAGLVTPVWNQVVGGGVNNIFLVIKDSLDQR